MNKYIKIGKSIIDKYADYAKNNTIDDEGEYFPTLKIIISGIAKASSQHDVTEKELIEYSKEQYVSTWVEHAKQDEENPDIKKETNDAVKQFDRFYFRAITSSSVS